VSYQSYGIEREFVERVKKKLKDSELKDRIKAIVEDVSKEDLQDRTKVARIVSQVTKALEEKLSERQTEQIVSFVLAQRIDPGNTFHLIRLWHMFR